jgi:16S rRNA G527 N7-methylase RsmG
VADNVRRAELESGLAVLGLNLSVLQVDALIEFVELLARWNQSYKLTAVTDRVAMVSRLAVGSPTSVPAQDCRESPWQLPGRTWSSSCSTASARRPAL